MAMCKECGKRYSQHRSGLCRTCQRAVEDTVRDLALAEDLARMEAHLAEVRARRRQAAPQAQILRTVVVEGRQYDVVFDGSIRDVEAAR